MHSTHIQKGHSLQDNNRYHETSHPDTADTVTIGQSQLRHSSYGSVVATLPISTHYTHTNSGSYATEQV